MLSGSSNRVLSSPTGHKIELLRAFRESIVVVYGQEMELVATHNMSCLC